MMKQGPCCGDDEPEPTVVDTAAGFPIEDCAPVATPRDAAVARVRQTLGHAADKLEVALDSGFVEGENALDLARAVAAVGRVLARLWVPS
jgi:hypothetical protein